MGQFSVKTSAYPGQVSVEINSLYFLAALSLVGAFIAMTCVHETEAKLAPGVVPAGE